MATFTAREKADCAKREVAQRVRVYGRLLSEGKMSQALHDKQIAMMREIAEEYAAKADAEEAKERLL